MSRLGFSVLLGAAVFAGCGARTDELEPGSGFGFGDGGAGATGGVDATGARSGGGGVSGGGISSGSGPGRGGTGGRPPATTGGGIARGGTGACGPNGCGGSVPSTDGGVAGAGASAGSCNHPDCSNCHGCMNACMCTRDDLAYCTKTCGNPTPTCEPVFCPTQSIPVIANPIPACCTPWGSCGVDVTQLGSVLDLPAGCEDRNQPAVPGECPYVPSPLGTTFPGCCRPNGTCGVDMSFLGVGCVETFKTSGLPCSFGTGGTPSTGGAPSSGGSPSVTECLAEARTPCEQCACANCTDEFLSCFEQDGCPDVLQCINVTGCLTSSVGCYAPSTCQPIADKYGLNSEAVSHAGTLLVCLLQNGCSCGFSSPAF